MESKTCTLCKQTKPINDFFNNKSLKDMKSYRCKICDMGLKMKPIKCETCNDKVIPQCNSWHHKKSVKHIKNLAHALNNIEINHAQENDGLNIANGNNHHNEINNNQVNE